MLMISCLSWVHLLTCHALHFQGVPQFYDKASGLWTGKNRRLKIIYQYRSPGLNTFNFEHACGIYSGKFSASTMRGQERAQKDMKKAQEASYASHHQTNSAVNQWHSNDQKDQSSQLQGAEYWNQLIHQREKVLGRGK